MKKYIATMVLSLVAIAIVSFGQTITIKDNASLSTPTYDIRNFGVPIVPTASTMALSNTVGTNTDDISRGWQNLPGNAVMFKQVATTSQLLAPTVPGVMTIQYESGNNKIHFRFLDTAGADWGCVATLSADMSAALN